MQIKYTGNAIATVPMHLRWFLGKILLKSGYVTINYFAEAI